VDGFVLGSPCMEFHRIDHIVSLYQGLSDLLSLFLFYCLPLLGGGAAALDLFMVLPRRVLAGSRPVLMIGDERRRLLV